MLQGYATDASLVKAALGATLQIESVGAYGSDYGSFKYYHEAILAFKCTS